MPASHVPTRRLIRTQLANTPSVPSSKDQSRSSHHGCNEYGILGRPRHRTRFHRPGHSRVGGFRGRGIRGGRQSRQTRRKRDGHGQISEATDFGVGRGGRQTKSRSNLRARQEVGTRLDALYLVDPVCIMDCWYLQKRPSAISLPRTWWRRTNSSPAERVQATVEGPLITVMPLPSPQSVGSSPGGHWMK